MLFLVILNSLFTDSLHFPSVFIHGLIQLFFNVKNRIKIITKVRLGLILGQVFPIIVECFSGIGQCIIARIQRRIQNLVNTHIYTSGIYPFCLYCLGSVCDKTLFKDFYRRFEWIPKFENVGLLLNYITRFHFFFIIFKNAWPRFFRPSFNFQCQSTKRQKSFILHQ